MPSVQGKRYASRSSATNAGTSCSCIGRMAISGSATSLLTAATDEYFLGELQIRPGLALLTGRAQQVSRVISHDDRNRTRSIVVDAPTHTADRRIGLEQVLRRDPTHRQDDARSDELDLALQVWRTVRRLLGPRFAVVGRPALEDV